jgi:hypothetical protein
MAYKKPNVKGPRLRRRNCSSVMDHNAYVRFKKEFPEHKDITPREFGAIVKGFNKNIVSTVLEERNGVLLPELIGRLLIMAFSKPNNKPIDFKASNEVGERVNFRNWDTEGRIGKLVFYSGSRTIKHGYLWGFKATKDFRKQVSESFIRIWAKYIFVDNKTTTINSVLK